MRRSNIPASILAPVMCLAALLVVAVSVVACGGEATRVGAGGSLAPTTAAPAGTTTTAAPTAATAEATDSTSSPTQNGSTTTSETASSDPADFSSTIDNEYFPLTAGATYAYEGSDASGPINEQVIVVGDTELVMGVECSIVGDYVFRGDELLRESTVVYAQDGEGNVWCFGRETKTYEGGEVAGTAGSWEAGVNGALPGLVMKAHPQVGEVYRQEYVEGLAENMAEVLELRASAESPYGSFDDVLLKTKNWSPLVPGVTEERYYAPGIGLVLVKQVEGGSQILQLMDLYAP